MRVRALSAGWYADRLMRGRVQPAIGLGHGHLLVGDYVITLTPPRTPRMPNGIECDLVIGPGREARIGDGGLAIDGIRVTPGNVWDARPEVRFTLGAQPRSEVVPTDLLGRGPGLTPEGDDILIGYLAGLVLFGRGEAPKLPTSGTTALSRTLLFHAARGELPEPAHLLLTRGDPVPLMQVGHSSGRAILVGLALAAADHEDGHEHALSVTVRDLGSLPDTIVQIFEPEGPCLAEAAAARWVA